MPDPLAAAVRRLALDPACDPDVAAWLELLLRGVPDDPAGEVPADAVDRAPAGASLPLGR
jgi:hypothetical protein